MGQSFIINFLGLSIEIPWLLGLIAFTAVLLYVIVKLFFPMIKFLFDELWLKARRKKFLAKQEYVLLHLITPKISEQGPEAMENLFGALAVAQKTGNWKEIYIDGYTQLSFSLEIVSFGGDVHFFINSPVKLHELVQSAIYISYKDIEVHEVEDYTPRLSVTFPSDQIELWGTNLVLYNKNPYPIRSYKYFEKATHDNRKFKDPLESVLEMLSQIKHGEEVWFQMIVTPMVSGSDADWIKDGHNLVKDIMKKAQIENKEKKKIGVVSGLAEEMYNQVWGKGGAGEGVKKEAKALPVSEGAKDVAKAVHDKISKVGFKVCPRVIYWAPKEQFSQTRGASAFVGALNGFNMLNMNGFKIDSKTKTGAKGFRAATKLAKKQNKILKAYKQRSGKASAECILNTEELASLFHFPPIADKVQTLRTMTSRRGRPPVGLPIE